MEKSTYINGDPSGGTNRDSLSPPDPIAQIPEPQSESQTGIYSGETIQKKFTELESRLEQVEKDKVNLEKLYEPESSILKVRDIMKDIREHLSEAIISEDELVRENQIDLIWNSILELQFYMLKNPISTNLNEGITMVQTALYNHRTKPLTRREIVILNIVFGRFRDNIKLPEDILDSCLDKMEDVGFDINSPMGEIDNINGTEE